MAILPPPPPVSAIEQQVDVPWQLSSAQDLGVMLQKFASALILMQDPDALEQLSETEFFELRNGIVQFTLLGSLYAPEEYRRELIHDCLEIFEDDGDDDFDDQIDDDFQRIIDRRNELIAGQNANSLDSDALIELGVLELAYFDNVSLAQAIFEEAVHQDHFSVRAKFWLAKSLFSDLSRANEALQVLNEALDIDPDSPECLSLSARILSQDPRWMNEAIVQVQRAVAVASDWPLLKLQLASMFLKVGEIEKAHNEMINAFISRQINPNSLNEVQRYFEGVITGRSWEDPTEFLKFFDF